jgi:hypothetical protein
MIGGCRCRAHHDVGAMAIASRSFAQQVLQPDLLVALPQDFVAFANGDIALPQDFIALPERLVALAQICVALGQSLIALALQFFTLSAPGKGRKAIQQAHEAPNEQANPSRSTPAAGKQIIITFADTTISLHCHQMIPAMELI